jgi:hypothetical protein
VFLCGPISLLKETQVLPFQIEDRSRLGEPEDGDLKQENCDRGDSYCEENKCWAKAVLMFRIDLFDEGASLVLGFLRINLIIGYLFRLCSRLHDVRESGGDI